MTTFVAFFPDERSAQQFVQQLALETSVSAITFLDEGNVQTDPYSNVIHQSEALMAYGFPSEQCVRCSSNIDGEDIAVIIEGSDAADMLTALHEYGVRHFHMA